MKKIVKIILSFVMVISFANIQSVKAIEQLQVNDQVMINDEEELKIHENSKIDQNHLLKGISLSLNDDAYTISYQVKENGIWSDGVSNGEVLSFNQMTSLKVILDTTDYDLSYRIYNETNQWSDWFKSNEEACFEDDSVIENYEVKVEEAKKESVAVSTQTNQETQIATYTEPRFSLVYNAHVANIGWQKEGDAISFQMGTTGRALGLEAVRLAVDTNLSGSIQYRAHVANIGWQSWVNNNEMAGTTGRAYSIEALQFQLTGELANQYDIYYRAHVSDYGWLGWTSNGNIAGSTGKAKKLEAIEIKIVRKGESGPTVSSSAYKYDVKYNYRGHSSDIGWLSTVGNNAYVGTTGRNKALEAFTLNVSNPVYAGAIQYQAYVANSGWQSWVSNGQTAGTTGKGLALNAVKIQLTGELSNHFDVYYRVHVSDMGWLGWTKNGEIAGAIGYGKKVEAIQVYVVEKGVNPYSIGGSYRYNEAPKISNIQISNVNSAGYTITCTVEDSDGISKVLFPTWTSNKGQDDLIWGAGTISGNTATFHVDTSAHGYETGNYITHIYAYDKTGKNSSTVAGTTFVETYPFYKGSYGDLLKAVDISEYQANLNLADIKNQIDFAILRVGYTGYVSGTMNRDRKFNEFYNQAMNNQIPVGVYYYSCATNIGKAVEEANFVINQLKGKNISYPVYIDFEDPTNQAGLDGSTKQAICNAFCLTIENAGYQAGVYSRQNFLFDHTTSEFDHRWNLWVSNYGYNSGQPSSNPYANKPYFNMWQYTSKGSLSGYNGNLDLNIWYVK